MTTIRASCPTCGDVKLVSREVRLRTCAEVNLLSYNFRCPNCQVRACFSASRAVFDMLVSSGCAIDVWYLPEELFELKVGSALMSDDLLDLHLILQQDDWFDRLKAITESI